MSKLHLVGGRQAYLELGGGTGASVLQFDGYQLVDCCRRTSSSRRCGWFIDFGRTFGDSVPTASVLAVACDVMDKSKLKNRKGHRGEYHSDSIKCLSHNAMTLCNLGDQFGNQ